METKSINYQKISFYNNAQPKLHIPFDDGSCMTANLLGSDAHLLIMKQTTPQKLASKYVRYGFGKWEYCNPEY